MDKLTNLKQLVDKMDSKTSFVESVADYYNHSSVYLLQNWFQREWKIPVKNVDKIIEMAQKELFKQTEEKRKLLIDTGYNL